MAKDSRKAKRFVVAFDSHGDMIDRQAEAAFFDFLKHFKPEVRIHGGDAFDLRALRKGASEEEKQEGMLADVEAGLDFLKRFDPQTFVHGNHDERLWDAAKDHRNGVIRSYCAQLIDSIVDQMPKMNHLPYDKREGVYRLGHLKVVHGFTSGLYAAKRAAEVYGCVLMGHVHTPHRYTIPSIETREGASSGCLAKLSMGYNRAHTNTLAQAHGWAYGFSYPNGEYDLFLTRCIEGRWLYPTEFREYVA